MTVDLRSVDLPAVITTATIRGDNVWAWRLILRVAASLEMIFIRTPNAPPDVDVGFET